MSAVAAKVPPPLFHATVARVHHRAEPVLRQLVRTCDRNGTAIDVGAWYGPWTYWLSRRVQRVVTFEPNPVLAAALRDSTLPNVTVVEAAASNRVGRATLHIPVAGKGSEGTATLEGSHLGAATFEVDTVRLDDLDLTEVSFVKIDVEGHEHAALEGAQGLLGSQFPVVLVELDTRLSDITRSMNLLTELGYEGRAWWEGKWWPSDELDLASWQAQHLDTAGSRGYAATVLRGPTWLNDIAWVHPNSSWSPW